MTKIDTRSRGGTGLRCTQTDRLSGVHRLQRRTRAVAVLRPSAGCRRHSSVQHAAKQEGADGEAGSITSGSEYADFNGYQLSMQASVIVQANWLTDSTTFEPIKTEQELVSLFGLTATDIVTS